MCWMLDILCVGKFKDLVNYMGINGCILSVWKMVMLLIKKLCEIFLNVLT